MLCLHKHSVAPQTVGPSECSSVAQCACLTLTISIFQGKMKLYHVHYTEPYIHVLLNYYILHNLLKFIQNKIMQSFKCQVPKLKSFAKLNDIIWQSNIDFQIMHFCASMVRMIIVALACDKILAKTYMSQVIWRYFLCSQKIHFIVFISNYNKSC